MPKAKQESKMQMMIAVLLGIAGLLILLIFLVIRSQADETTTSGTLDNVFPTITLLQVGTTPTGNEVIVASSTNLTEGTTTTIYVNGTIEDLNGCEDVTQGAGSDAVIVLSSPSNDLKFPSNGPSDFSPTSYYAGLQAPFGGTNHLGLCTLSGCDDELDINVDFVCTLDYEYYADNTTTDTPKGIGESLFWVTRVRARDAFLANLGEIGPTTTWATTTFEMNLLTAVDAGASLLYGSLSVGETSATTSLTITNTGNDNTTDLDLIGTDMTCTTGTIAVTQQKYGTSSVVLGNTLTLTSSTVFDFNLAKQTVTSTLSTSTMDFTNTATEASAGSLAGTCTGTNTIYATPF